MKLLLFDIDGTLIDSGRAGSHAFFRALREEFLLAEIAGDVSFSGRTDRAILRDLFQRHDLEDSDANWQRFREAYLRYLPESLKERQGLVLPGVIELLDQLATRDDVTVGLLTGNTRAGAHAKLGHFRLVHYFAFGGYGDEHYERDDVARMAVEEARAVLREVQPSETWVIGDTPHDIRCARAIGARCVAVATGIHPEEELAPHKPDILLPDMSDLEQLLAAWGASAAGR